MAYRKTEFVERKRLETRARIVEAAVGQVTRGGWRACVLKSIAREAGVSTGAIYTHFERVTDLYIEAFSTIAEQELAVIGSIVDGSGAPPVRLAAAVETFMARALRGPARAYAVIEEPVAPEVDRVRQLFRRRFVLLFEKIIRDGVALRVFPPQNAEVSAACALGAMAEALIPPLASGRRQSAESVEQLRADVLAFCRRAVGETGKPVTKQTITAAREGANDRTID
ncbi:MAG: TetR/AcrR family transcriptional regulator [Pseudomonadota bacterium]